jgi:hypothetical protein
MCVPVECQQTSNFRQSASASDVVEMVCELWTTALPSGFTPSPSTRVHQHGAANNAFNPKRLRQSAEVSGEAIDSWRQMKSRRWARTSLHRVVASPTTVSMWDAVTSFTTGQWSANCAGIRWKKFLLHASRDAPRSARSASCAQLFPRCGVPSRPHRLRHLRRRGIQLLWVGMAVPAF